MEKIPKNRILIADDASHILRILKFNLEHEGFEVFTAKDGDEAVEVAKKVIPDIILMDIAMPNLDGCEACKILRKEPQISEKPIIMLTAMGQFIDKQKAIESGASDFISKPFSPSELIKKIKNILEL